MTAHDVQAQGTIRTPAPELRGPQIISAGGTASLHLTLAVCDYEHVREIAQGLVRADGITLTPLIFPSIEEITFRFTKSSNGTSRSSRSASTFRSPRRAPTAPMVAIPVFPVARPSPFRDLCPQRPRHQDREGPRGPRRRHSRMGADRRHLCARHVGRGPGRRPRQNPLAAGRRQRARTRGEGRAQASPRHPIPGAAGHEPLGHAGERRGRCGDLRPRAGGVRSRWCGGAAFSRTIAPRRNASSRRPASSRSCI